MDVQKGKTPKVSQVPESLESRDIALPDGAAQEARVHQRGKDALAACPGGAQPDRYFAVTSGVPLAPPAECREAKFLLDEYLGGRGCASELLQRISTHVAASGADPAALRALRRPAKK